jgi:thiol-disulfide isomerase/thioredoxin
MLRLFTFLLILNAPFWAFAQDSGISFLHNGEWETAVAKAKSENKLIFMDAYTTWCGPCKMMSKQVFPNEQVAGFYNTNFVNVKMDMEKGEGLDLAQKFAVMAYPTLLFIDPVDQSVAHRTAGFLPVDAFVQLGKDAQDPSKRLAALDKKYAKGNREPEFLYNYAKAKLATFDGNAGEIGAEYLKTQTDWKSEKNMEMVFDFVDDPNSEMFRFLTKNKDIFVKKYGQQAVMGRIEDIIARSISQNPNITLPEISGIFKNAYPENGEEMASRYAMTFYRQRGDRAGFADAAIAYFKKYPTKNAEELNEVAWTFYQVIENEKQLKTAVKWAKKSIKMAPGYYNYDTLAALLFKLKDKKGAKKAAEKAISLARANGEDFSATQELLDKINKL